MPVASQDQDPTMTIGTRVRLKHEVWRYPHFIAPQGAVGTVTMADGEMFCVRMDDDLGPGALEWDNEVQWYIPNGDDPYYDLELA